MTGVTTKLPRDSVLAYIPLNVTADLGVAMRRVRPKRIARLKSLYPSLSETNDGIGTCSGTTEDSGAEVSRSGEESDNEDDSSRRRKKNKMTKTAPRVPQRDHFGSVLDYLEAKYVKGVMIEDLDERVREKRKNKKKKRESENGTASSGNGCASSIENDNSVLSDSAAGSCYSSGSGGFIDDAGLQSEVAGQVRASSAYGTTRIEAEAALDRRGGSEKDGGSDDNDDHAFFVNVGDLEMEEGYVDYDEDDARGWMDVVGKGKGKKRKRAPKENPSSPKDAANKPKPSSKRSKNVSEKPKQKKRSKSSSNKSQSQTSKDSDSSSTKTTTPTEKQKKKKIKVEKTKIKVEKTKMKEKTKEKKTVKDKKKVTEKAKEKTKEKAKSKKKVTEKVTEKIKEKDAESTASSELESSIDIPAKKEKKEKEEKETLEMTLIDVAKKEAAGLKTISNRLYKKCVSLIKGMTDEHLPRKPKSVGKTKVSITVPAHKKGGDKITFSNPHFPSQKLKVQIPDTCKPGKSFKVSVPMPKISKAPGNAQNKFAKDVTETLDEYSKAYDEWCLAEAKHRALKPKKEGGKIKHFKAGVERLKKYDEMLDEFPKNLLVPIDAVFIRKLVRRNRQNANKRMKALAVAATMEAATATAVMEKASAEKLSTDLPPAKKQRVESATMSLAVPGKGSVFPSVPFKEADFERTEVETVG